MLYLWTTVDLQYSPSFTEGVGYGIQVSAPPGHELVDWHAHPIESNRIIVCWKPIVVDEPQLAKIPEQAMALIQNAVQRWARKHFE